jgi:DNA (cytosine-5)-methyltransferase 1
MKHYGDVSQMNGAEIDPVDIITFGSPCQDMSVAGKRAGLDGERSGLFYQATRIIREMRDATDGKYPRWAVWENVPGAFSSNKGRDFKAVLEELISVSRYADTERGAIDLPLPDRWDGAGLIMGDCFSVAWRVLDAQYWGVPQRRKRIYLVADLTGQCAGEVLFECEGVPRHTAQGVRPWERIAGDAERGIDEPSVYDNHAQDCRYSKLGGVGNTVTSRYGTGGVTCRSFSKKTYALDRACYNQGKNAQYKPQIDEEMAQTVVAKGPGAVATTAYGISSKDSNAMKSANPNSGIYGANTSRTLDNNGGNPACNQGGMMVLQDSMIGRKEKNDPQGSGVTAHSIYTTSKSSYHTEAEEDVANTLVATDYKDPPTVTEEPYYRVRRLTPTECARLQGFPDEWCHDLGVDDPSEDEMTFWRGVFDTYGRVFGKKPRSDTQIRKWLKDPHTDSAEYKMWGNGVALPCVVYVLGRIKEVSE